MRIASVVLVLTLLSTCIISGTFAKYVTSQNGTDNARVAYWGFDETAALQIDGLFSDVHAVEGKANDVDSQDNDNVLAPGTTGNTSFTFTYSDNTGEGFTAPEVAYEFKIEVSTNWDGTGTSPYAALDANPNFYWNLKTPGDKSATGNKYSTLQELLNAILLTSGDATGKKIYAPNTLPEWADGEKGGKYGVDANTYTITWTWDFDDEGAATNDVTDTAMGNAAALDNLVINIKITATQVNEYTAA